MGDAAARRPGRRGDQDRGPGVGGDVGRYVPPYRDGGGLAVLRDVQPRQAQRVARPAHAGGPRGLRGPRARRRRRLLQPARRPAGEAAPSRYEDLRDVNPRIVCCSLSGFGNTGPRAAEPRLRLHAAGADGLDGADRRARRAADEVRRSRSSTSRAATWRRSRCWPACGAPAATASAATATSRCSRPRLSLLTYVGTWAASRGHAPARRAESAHPSIVPFQAFETADGWIDGRLREAEVLGQRCARRWAPDLATTSGSPSSTSAPSTATPCSRSCGRCSRARTPTSCVARLSAAGVPVRRRSTTCSARSRTAGGRARGASWLRASARSATVRQFASPLRLGATHARARTRRAHRAAVARPVRLRRRAPVRAAREGGAFG